MLRRLEIEPVAFSAQKETPFAGRKPRDAISGEVHHYVIIYAILAVLSMVFFGFFGAFCG